MRRHRRAKIVATLGPASGNQAMIEKLFRAGTDVFRINMSHTSHDRMRELIAMIRKVEADNERPIGILVDLQGPKLRVGTFEGGSAQLKQGDTFVLDSDAAAGNSVAGQPAASRKSSPRVEPGHTLLLDDGKVRLSVQDAGPKSITTKVEVGGKLSDRKGVSLPDTVLPFSALAPKGPLRPRSRARRRHRLGRAVLHPAARGHRRSQEDHARPRLGDGQDREAAGGDSGSTRSWSSPTR